MKKIITLCLALVVGIVMLPSCSKKKGCTDPTSISYDPDAEENDGSCAYAGTGGNTIIVAKPEHHGVPIISDSVHLDTAYVKFNTSESPGLTAASYDLVVPGEDGEDHVHLEGLKPGKYYILMTGYDNSINQRVIGGIPYTLTQSSGEVDVVVPVSE